MTNNVQHDICTLSGMLHARNLLVGSAPRHLRAGSYVMDQLHGQSQHLDGVPVVGSPHGVATSPTGNALTQPPQLGEFSGHVVEQLGENPVDKMNVVRIMKSKTFSAFFAICEFNCGVFKPD